MKKRRIILILLSLMVSSLYAVEPIYEEKQFEVIFQKPGETDFYFTEGTTNVRSQKAVEFNPVFAPTDSTTGNFGFYWEVYHDGAVTIELKFSSGHQQTVTNSDGTSYSGDYMLYSTEGGQGLNYNVELNDGLSTIDDSCTPNEITSVSHVPLTEEQRTIKLYEGNATNIQGTSGHAVFDLSMDPPIDSEGHVGFIKGQYVGQIEFFITTI